MLSRSLSLAVIYFFPQSFVVHCRDDDRGPVIVSFFCLVFLWAFWTSAFILFVLCSGLWDIFKRKKQHITPICVKLLFFQSNFGCYISGML